MGSIHRDQGRSSLYPLVYVYHFNADLALKTRGYPGSSFLAYYLASGVGAHGKVNPSIL